MFTLFRSLWLKQGVTQQLPALLTSLCLTEFLYTFHSFLLECGAFLATWFALDAIIQGVIRITNPKWVSEQRGLGF